MVVAAYFLNCDEIRFEQEEVTVNEVRTVCARELGTFGPDISLIYAHTGEECTSQRDGDESIALLHGKKLTAVYATRLMLDRDDIFWCDAVRMHLEAKDDHGAYEALQSVAEGKRSGLLAFIKMQQMSKNVGKFLARGVDNSSMVTMVCGAQLLSRPAGCQETVHIPSGHMNCSEATKRVRAVAYTKRNQWASYAATV